MRLVGDLYIVIIVAYLVIVVSDSLSASDVYSFHNPNVLNMSAEEITLSFRNKCALYPRCMLFNCCSTMLQTSVDDYFSTLNSRNSTNKHSNPMPITERAMNISLFTSPISKDILVQGLVNLPPTPPQDYENIYIDESFRILFVIQGDYFSNLPEWYSQELGDVIFLSYKDPAPGMPHKYPLFFFLNI